MTELLLWLAVWIWFSAGWVGKYLHDRYWLNRRGEVDNDDWVLRFSMVVAGLPYLLGELMFLSGRDLLYPCRRWHFVWMRRRV